MTDQCGTCAYYNSFYHRCRKIGKTVSLETEACPDFRDVDDNRILNRGFAEILQIRLL